MRKIFLGFMAMAALTSCATPPGQLKESDFVWMKHKIETPIESLVYDLKLMARKCNGLLKEFKADWLQSPDGKDITVDLFLSDISGGHSNWVAGVIKLAAANNGTEVSAGVQKIYSRPIFGGNDIWVPKFEQALKDIESGAEPSCP